MIGAGAGAGAVLATAAMAATRESLTNILTLELNPQALNWVSQEILRKQGDTFFFIPETRLKLPLQQLVTVATSVDLRHELHGWSSFCIEKAANVRVSRWYRQVRGGNNGHG